MTMNQEQALTIDKEDLVGLLELRFGAVPPTVQEEIGEIKELETVERLILVAANVPTWDAFLADLGTGTSAFKIVGDVYNPIPNSRSEV